MTNGQLGLYNYSARTVERYRLSVETHPGITSANKNAILRFFTLCKAEGLSHNRLGKILWMMRNWGEWIGEKDLIAADKQDVVDLVNVLQSKSYMPHTIHDHKKLLKKFFKCVVGNGRTPDIIAWMRVGSVRSTKDPASIFTDHDVLKLLQAQESQNLPWVRTRNKALIAFLYESGVRVGELLPMRVRDVDTNGDLWRVTVSGKTGQRTIPVVTSVPYLRAYLAVHPRISDHGAPLWCSYNNVAERLSYERLSEVLRRAATRAGIEKPANPHNFRHSAVSRDADFMSDQHLKLKYGWSPASRQLATYSHIRLEALETALRKRYGLPEVEPSSTMIPRHCGCGAANEPHSRFCWNCHNPLSTLGVCAAEPGLPQHRGV
jgi:site-specific recombinase XerD